MLNRRRIGAFFCGNMSKERQINKEKQKGIEIIREYFVDPDSPESAEDLANLSSESIRVMAQIYASSGDSQAMSEEVRNWLTSQSGDNLEKVLKKLLLKESNTRRFDAKFFGQIHPQGSKIGVISNLIAAYMNTNTIVREVSGSEHEMELAVTEWLADMFGYDKAQSSGNITTGGTTANVTALWVAREKVLKARLGISGARNRNMFILGTHMSHYSVDKSANLLGSNVWLGKVPEKGFVMDLDRTEEIIRKIQDSGREIAAIIGLAGETETGMVDDLDGIADIAEKYNIHFHVDAAYGGPFVLSERRDLFKGIDRADSIAVDPHKMLYTPYAAGAVLLKDKKDHALIQKNARYLNPKDNDGLLGDPKKRNFGFAARLEGSMSSQGVMSTWATKELFGEEGLSKILNHTLELTDHAYDMVSQSTSLRPLHKPHINTLLIGLKSGSDFSEDEYKQKVLDIKDKVEEKYGYYISHNAEVDNGRSAFRFVAMHPHSTLENVEGLIEAMDKEAFDH